MLFTFDLHMTESTGKQNENDICTCSADYKPHAFKYTHIDERIFYTEEGIVVT